MEEITEEHPDLYSFNNIDKIDAAYHMGGQETSWEAVQSHKFCPNLP
jgi:hypothetical protein